jgi:hypothetical protein
MSQLPLVRVNNSVYKEKLRYVNDNIVEIGRGQANGNNELEMDEIQVIM